MYVAIMGYGVVGSGVAEVLAKNHESIQKRSTQSNLDLKYILDIRDFQGDVNAHLITKDFNVILNDPEVSVVVETMGGLHPAYDFVRACLEANKSVVTSNKELVASKGCELLRIAREHGVSFLFEASVAGGIPIIRPLAQCLAANEIDEIIGILNGTTNFILTKMISEGLPFEEVLKTAQKNGYAESNPSADIEGLDACRKICILSSLVYGKHVYPDSVYTEGISKIDLADVAYAGSWGGVIKLIARTRRVSENKIFIMVSPAFVPGTSQLATVDDVFNAILVRGNATGDVVFYGKGAGKLPTASAVVADVIDCARHRTQSSSFGWDEAVPDYVIDYLDAPAVLFVRATAENRDDALSAAKKTFGDITVLTRTDAPAKELAFITPQATERENRTKLETLHMMNVLSVIRVLN